jgi:hypothetical protein
MFRLLSGTRDRIGENPRFYGFAEGCQRGIPDVQESLSSPSPRDLFRPILGRKPVAESILGMSSEWARPLLGIIQIAAGAPECR